ncbi:MAG TPA: methyltransferase [Phenylobacterium sp.]|jgi:predicted methyltransferase|uniref:class I SAM-dependent methyltransferase n=1 Tax=Phenylobacterium sp. TaxID=1871053 RepID=UPI002B95729C|nr:methyltransferase [Phenylobacterium sp.]HXA39169.1 methyltransferase [Phenylobacterium sp.]
MRRLRGAVLALAVCMGAAVAGGVLAQPPKFDIRAPTDPSRGDALNNPEFKGPQVLKFIGVKPGDRVADVFSGRFTTALAAAVGPKGRVYAVVPEEAIKIHPELRGMVEARAKDPAYANVEITTPEIDAMVLPPRLDAVFIRQNYHDLHVGFMGPADVPAFNRKVFAALKPGGVYVVLDHAATPGAGLAVANRLHRIDPADVKAEVTAAGFVLDAESPILANPADAHDRMVLEPVILGKTDQFLFRFRKPK